jgi:amidase
MDAVGQAQLARSGRASPLELVDAAVARVERLNPELNAVVHSTFDRAREEARRVPGDAPFAGVPFLLKDLVAEQAGTPLREGSRFLEGYVSEADSELVARYRRAGLVSLGKTNTPEFGLLATTEPSLFGPTRNPRAPGRTPGGSSGGAAAAVAAGMVPAAHGNDGGGSIRIPASCCGLFGLKPTRARNPLGPRYGDLFNRLVVEHALTRSVRDSAALLDVSCGPGLGDRYVAPLPARPFLEEVVTDPGPLRIAFSRSTPTGRELHPDCWAALEATVSLCASLGHQLVEKSPPLEGRTVGRAFATLWAAGCSWSVGHWARVTGRRPGRQWLEPLTWELYQRGRRVTADVYVRAVEDVQVAARAVAAFLEEHDLWLTPTLALPPLLLGELDSRDGDTTRPLRRMGEFSPFTHIANLTGHPAMSVPLYRNEAGLPIGTHFLARFGDEATLFRLAGQLERAQGWS